MNNAGDVTTNAAEKSVAEFALDYLLPRAKVQWETGSGVDIAYSLGVAGQGRAGFQQKPQMVIARAGANITIFDIVNSESELGTPESPLNSGIYRLGGTPEQPAITRAPMWGIESNRMFYRAVGEFLFGSNWQAAAFGQLGPGRNEFAIMKALRQNRLPPAEAQDLLGRLKAEGIDALEYLRN